MPRLEIQLVDPTKVKHRVPTKIKAILILLAMAFVAGVSAGVTHNVWPKSPSKLSAQEAARILKRQNGYAGYSLISSGNKKADALAHVIFCPSCGVEIANVNVVFLKNAEPTPGSKMAVLQDTIKRMSPDLVAQTHKTTLAKVQ